MRTPICISSTLVVLSLAIFNICIRPCLGNHPKEKQGPSLSNFITPVLDKATNETRVKFRQELSPQHEAGPRNIDYDSEDFEPYRLDKSHPIYSPILASHLDDDPNEELNSLHTRVEEDPLLEETEEDVSSENSSVPIKQVEPIQEKEESYTEPEQIQEAQPTAPLEQSSSPMINDEPTTESSAGLSYQFEVPTSSIPRNRSSENLSGDISDEPDHRLEQPTVDFQQPPLGQPLELSLNQSVAQPLDDIEEPSMEQSSQEPVQSPEIEQPVVQSTTQSSSQLFEQPSTNSQEMDDELAPMTLTSQTESLLPIVEEQPEEKSTRNEVSHDSSSEDGSNLSSTSSHSDQPELYESLIQFRMDPTILIYTLFCIVCVSILNLGKWFFVGPKTAKTSTDQPKSSTESLKDLKSLQNLKNQAERLRFINQRLIQQIEVQKKLKPIKNEIASLRENTGEDVKARIADRKLHLKNLKNLLLLQQKRDELEQKIQRFKHEHLATIQKFIELDNLIDLLKDIEFQGLCNNLRESIFKKKIEIDVLREQHDTFEAISKQFQVQCDQLTYEIKQEKDKAKMYDNELAELREIHRQLDENDSIDSWKSRIAEKISQTDKFYSDYYYNYRYMQELMQVA